MKKLILFTMILTSSMAVHSRVSQPGQSLQGDEILSYVCPEDINLELSGVPVKFTSLSGTSLQFESSYVSINSNFARCIYQYSNYKNNQQNIWFYCPDGTHIIQVSEKEFRCQ